ncbi:hypothetical protein HS1genome_1017 [Sulfodiicoccus acidiphilus]|uniref:Uncharacterized protein n=2 Tax=Sulfodiicoccus acidiphilus TaxID=1670455 RepID=A0A348B376_9CREN|nr:hypothetical protein HS1genome_1017 [Sulfodiicoccus acidiphilus]GGT93211.1 hypothetical protein GCM10007116_08590 [Sulfodiicoccus acidiphilus]
MGPTVMDSKRLDEARRLLAKAETKYKFSTYGGDYRRLLDYLLSPDFTELLLVLGVDLAKKLLQAIAENYQDQDIKECVDKLLNEIDGYESQSEETTSRMLTY